MKANTYLNIGIEALDKCARTHTPSGDLLVSTSEFVARLRVARGPATDPKPYLTAMENAERITVSGPWLVLYSAV